MKKLTTILLALMVVLFTQCKKDNIDSNDNDYDNETRKVKVRCEIPLGNGTRSDFSNLMTDGSIKWSTGTERIYLAVHHETNAQIVELTAEATLPATILAFEGEVDETILTDGETYNVWYLGNSQNLGENSYVTTTETNGIITSVNGSIANQSGSLEDLGHHHIAKAEVTATLESDGNYTLPLHGTLQNQIAIAYMDLTDVTKLSGDAIIGTDYSLEYSNGEYNFVISEESKEINITPRSVSLSVSESSSSSFVVLLPNSNTNVDITNNNYYKYAFKDGIAASSLYYRYISDVEMGTLKWEWMEGYGENNGHIYVDLGLPSGLKWATCNVGASAPEEYGNYYTWGETEVKSAYTFINSLTYDLSISELQSQGYIDGSGNLTPSHDAATANWGGSWRMPTKAECQELVDNCIWEWTTHNGVDGKKVTGPNGNNIFLPAAGDRLGSSLGSAGEGGDYCSSTPGESDSNCAYSLIFNSGNQYVLWVDRSLGLSVRPVSF